MKWKKWSRRQEFVVTFSVILAILVILSAFFLRQTNFWDISSSHAVEAVRILGDLNITEQDRQELLQRQEQLAEIQEDYTDAVAWILIPGTAIDYPLMYTETYDYYVDHNYDGSEDYYGEPFLDYRNQSDFSDFVSMVYGHDMSNGTMFASLSDFREAETFDEVQSGYLIFSDGVRRLEFIASFAGSRTLADALTDGFSGVDDVDAYLDTLLEEALQQRQVTMNEDDQLMVLSTLTYDAAESTDQRPTLLLAKLEPLEDITE